MSEFSGLGMNTEEVEEDHDDDKPVAEPDPKLEDKTEGETASSHVYFSAYGDNRRSYNPYFPFSDSESDSDSGTGWVSDSRLDANRSIDCFDRHPSEFGTLENEFDSDPNPDLMGDFNLWGFEDAEEEEEGELGFGLGIESGSDPQRTDLGGLRVARIDSDSDYEDDAFDLNDTGWEGDEPGRVEDESYLPTIWDSFFGEEEMERREELEWEEVQNSINRADVPITIRVEADEEEEISASSRISSVENHERDLDWEVLLAVNNVVNYIEEAEGIDIGVNANADAGLDYYLYLSASDGNMVNYGDYDAIFGHMFDNESGIRGSPPAAKSVVEELPLVEFTVEELSKGDMVCAVCKEEITVEEKVRRLPCWHYYHGECIVPWLGIRNTCPVCRYELPTDDPEYERNRRRQRVGSGLARESLVRYDSEFEMFA